MADKRSPAFLKIGPRTLAFHIFKNLRLFDKKIVAGLFSKDNNTSYVINIFILSYFKLFLAYIKKITTDLLMFCFFIAT